MSDELKKLSIRLDDRAEAWLEPVKHMEITEQAIHPNWVMSELLRDIARQIRAVEALIALSQVDHIRDDESIPRTICEYFVEVQS